jgi:ankyrin repeat protein
LVKTLLQGDSSLAYVPDSNGLFPIHAAACKGNVELVTYFMREYHDSSELQDHHGRNIFHYVAQENKKEVFTELFCISETDAVINKMVTRMINEIDSEGNTPLNVATMKGHMLIMIAISDMKKHNGDSILIPNNDNFLPFDLSVIQMKRTRVISQV